MKMEISKKQVKSGLFKKTLKEYPDEKTLDKKMQLRYLINNSIFDLHDSVADNAKMISLIFALLYRIYEALPDTVKDSLDPKDREVIEYAFQKYQSIETRADVEFKTNGIQFIDKLMDRQHQIAEYFKAVYNVK